MDNLKFGSFIAQLRKENNMTQKELADRLNVTDKAVSKWETGKGFPDVKLMEPLAKELGVSLVELLQGERQQVDTLSVEEAGNVAKQAMECSERETAWKYLRLLRALLTGIGAWCALDVWPYVWIVGRRLWHELFEKKQLGIIGGADGLTYITVGTATMPPLWLDVGLSVLALVICGILVLRVWKFEKKLK